MASEPPPAPPPAPPSGSGGGGGGASASLLRMPAAAWDPLHPTNLANRNPSLECRKRIRRDLKAMRASPLPLIFPVMDEDLATVVHALIVGPFDTPYEGGFFWFVMNCPDDYPNSPPKVKLMTTGGGGVRFNPNLYANGKVCLSILGTWSGPGWSPAQSLASVLLSVQSLMNEKPYHNEPGFEVARGPRDVENYNDCIGYERLRVAVCDICGDSSTAQSLPPALRTLARDLFPNMYDQYHLAVSGAVQRGKDGAPMIDPFGHNKGVMAYSKIGTRLAEIKAAIEAEQELITAESEESTQGDNTSSATEDPAVVGAERGGSTTNETAEIGSGSA